MISPNTFRREPRRQIPAVPGRSDIHPFVHPPLLRPWIHKRRVPIGFIGTKPRSVYEKDGGSNPTLSVIENNDSIGESVGRSLEERIKRIVVNNHLLPNPSDKDEHVKVLSMITPNNGHPTTVYSMFK